jgi:hypothetical protein
MKKLLIFIRNKTALLTAIMMAAVVGGATTALVMAAIPDSNGVIQGCIRPTNQNLRIIDTEAGQNCTGGQTPISWDQSAGGKIYGNRVEVSYGSTGGANIVTIPNVGEFIMAECISGNPNGLNSQVIYHNTTSSTFEYTLSFEGPSDFIEPDETVNINDANGVLASGVDPNATLVQLSMTGEDNIGNSFCRTSVQAIVTNP